MAISFLGRRVGWGIFNPCCPATKDSVADEAGQPRRNVTSFYEHLLKCCVQIPVWLGLGMMLGLPLNVWAEELFDNIQILTPVVGQYEKAILTVTPKKAPFNPFDPQVVSLDALITCPAGRKVRVPGFWYQGYRRSLQNPDAQESKRAESLEKEGPAQWRVHFSSGEIGLHRIILEMRDQSGIRRSVEKSITVNASTHPEFIRISPRNRQYLEFESGRPFFPIGLNLCMYRAKEGTYYYDRLLGKLKAGGGNYVRLWQEYYVPREELTTIGRSGGADYTGFPLETQATGLGRYDLESAWRLDYVSELCEQLDLYWQITFEMTVWWQQKMPFRWKRNPYNAANGGPCALPADYFTSPAARELVERRLRYSVARWGWSTHLIAWELWNEVDNNEGFESNACAAWHREMGTYLKRIDPWKHLVTTSWRDRQTFGLPQIDLVQGHSYFGPEYDAAQYAIQDTEHLMRGFGKPFFFGEQGIEGPVSVDPEGKHFHDLVWVTALSGAAGCGLYWWWENYVDHYNLYHHYAGLAQFTKEVNWPDFDWKPIQLSRPNLPVTLNVYGLAAPDRALLWIHDPLAFRIVEGEGVRGPRQAGASVNVVGLADGNYEIEWWDTFAGKTIRREATTVDHLTHFGYGIELKPPEFWGDLAARIIRQGKKW